MVRMSHLGKNRGKGTLGSMTSKCKVDEVGGITKHVLFSAKYISQRYGLNVFASIPKFVC